MFSKTYDVHPDNVAALQTQLIKLNRRAGELNCPPVVWQVGTKTLQTDANGVRVSIPVTITTVDVAEWPHRDTHVLAWYAELERTVDEATSDYVGFRHDTPLLQFLAFVVSSIRRKGWVSSSKA